MLRTKTLHASINLLYSTARFALYRTAALSMKLYFYFRLRRAAIARALRFSSQSSLRSRYGRLTPGAALRRDNSSILYVKEKIKWLDLKQKKKTKERLYFKKVKQRGLSINKNKRMIWLLVLKKEKIKALVLKRLKEKGGLKFKRMIKGVY